MDLNTLALFLAVFGFLMMHGYLIIMVLRHCWYIDDLLERIFNECEKAIRESAEEE